MRSLSNLGIGLILVSSFLLLALILELYYLLWWKKKKTPNKEIEDLLYWKNPSSSSSKALNVPQEISTSNESIDAQIKARVEEENEEEEEDEEGIEAELMRLHKLAGPPRFLFTIKEETREDLESEDGKYRGGRSRKSSRGRSLSDVLTPLSSPPLYNINQHGVFDSLKASPPQKFKFLRDAEEKFLKAPSDSKVLEEGDIGTFITVRIGSSQVNPLPSAPIVTREHVKLGSYILEL